MASPAVGLGSGKDRVLLDENGRAYTVSANAVPGGKGDGVPITSLVDLQGKAPIVSLLADEEEGKGRILLASDGGYGFVTEIGNLIARNAASEGAIRTDTWKNIDTATSLIRQKMTSKYGIEFR